ncbi:MAG: GlgB N-terminal domain-containing protein, partial [Microbacterium sp.]
MTPSDQVLDAVGAGAHHEPHSVLGIHPAEGARGDAEWVVRARRPLARSVTAV